MKTLLYLSLCPSIADKSGGFGWPVQHGDGEHQSDGHKRQESGIRRPALRILGEGGRGQEIDRPRARGGRGRGDKRGNNILRPRRYPVHGRSRDRGRADQDRPRLRAERRKENSNRIESKI